MEKPMDTFWLCPTMDTFRLCPLLSLLQGTFTQIHTLRACRTLRARATAGSDLSRMSVKGKAPSRMALHDRESQPVRRESEEDASCCSRTRAIRIDPKSRLYQLSLC